MILIPTTPEVSRPKFFASRGIIPHFCIQYRLHACNSQLRQRIYIPVITTHILISLLCAFILSTPTFASSAGLIPYQSFHVPECIARRLDGTVFMFSLSSFGGFCVSFVDFRWWSQGRDGQGLWTRESYYIQAFDSSWRYTVIPGEACLLHTYILMSTCLCTLHTEHIGEKIVNGLAVIVGILGFDCCF